MAMLLKSHSTALFIIVYSLIVLSVALVKCNRNTEDDDDDANCLKFVGVGVFAQCSCHQSASRSRINLRICAECRWLPPVQSNQSNAQIRPCPLLVNNSRSSNMLCTNNYKTRSIEPLVRGANRNSTCDKYFDLVSQLYRGRSIRNAKAPDANDSSRWEFCWRDLFGCNYTIELERQLSAGNSHQKGDTFHYHVGSFTEDSPSNHVRLGVRYVFKRCGEGVQWRFRPLRSTDESSDATKEPLMQLMDATNRPVTKAQETKETHVFSDNGGLFCARLLCGGVVLLASATMLLF